MIDNSWTSSDRKATSAQSRMMRTKVIITVAIILVGAIGTVLLYGVGSNATQYRSDGLVVDFGDYLTLWTDAEIGGDHDPVGMLDTAKKQHANTGFEYTITDGKLTDVKYNSVDYPNDSTHTWNLWTVSEGKFDAVRNDDYSLDISDYTAVIWAYTEADGEPMVAVDATGTSIYGYAEPYSLVSLSPVCTETLNSVRGTQKIVGTDMYSDYPEAIRTGHDDGSIAIVGSYTDPSYEAIMKTSPEMVFCDSSTYNQVQIAGMLRSSNVNAVVLYNGEDIDTICKNIFISGIAIGYNLAGQAYIQKLNFYIDALEDLANSVEGSSAMVSLSSDPSPWVAGNYTYVNDIVEKLNSDNVFGSTNGWANITAESIHQKNPGCIIVIGSDTYSASEYDTMIANLSSEWKSTDAYANGRIYLLSDDMGLLASRAGPRFIQLMEIMCQILTPDAYADPIPKAIGDDYHDYLYLTGGME